MKDDRVGGLARVAEFCGGIGLGFDETGPFYIAEGCNYRLPV